MDFTRQQDLVSPEKLAATSVHLIGCGGIGSPTGLALAKMGVGQITLWDGDRVEEHNLPNQFHLANSEGEFKVNTLRDLMHSFSSETDIRGFNADLTGEERALKGIVVSAVDSMASRKKIWAAARFGLGVTHYIEARMGGEMLILYSLDPHNPLARDEYEKTLHSDEEALELPCTARSIIYAGMMAGSLIANAVKRHVMGEDSVFEVIFDMTSLTLLARELP